MYRNGKYKKRRFSFSKVRKILVCFAFSAILIIYLANRTNQIEDDDLNFLRKSGSKSAWICVTGQLERLELDSKIEHLIKPLSRRHIDVHVDFVLSRGKASFTTKGKFKRSPFRFDNIALPNATFQTWEFEKIENPPVNEHMLAQLNKAWFSNKDQVRRAENHYRQYATLHECFQHMPKKTDIIVRVRDDAFIHRINWDEIIHALNRHGPTLLTPSYAHWEGLNDKIAFLDRAAAKTYFTQPLDQYQQVPPAWVQNPETYYYSIYDRSGLNLETTDSIQVVTSRYDSDSKLQLHGVSPTELDIVKSAYEAQNVWRYVDCITVITLKTEQERGEKFLQEAERVGMPVSRIRTQLEDLDPDGGTAGCFRAHVRAVQHAYDQKCKNVLVFEPDTYFHGDYEKSFRDMSRFLETGEYYDVFFLGHYPISRMHKTTHEGIYRSFSSFHGHARMVSRSFMKRMILLEYDNLHLDNRIAIMKPQMLAVYPMVAFQHAHESIVSPFKNSRSESDEESLRQKLIKAETDACTRGRQCYMPKANPEGKTLSPKVRESLCTWTRKHIWMYTDRPIAYLNKSSDNLIIEQTDDENLLKNLQYRRLFPPSDIYVFPKSKYEQHILLTEGLSPSTGLNKHKDKTVVLSNTLPVVHHYVDDLQQSVLINLKLASNTTVYEFSRCKSEFVIWNGLFNYRNDIAARQMLERKWVIHPRYDALDWSGVNWNSVTTPDHYSHMILFSLRPLLSLYWYDRGAFDHEVWRFYTSCGYACRVQVGGATTHATAFRIMVNVLGHSPKKFIREDVQLLLTYPKKTKNNHVLAEAMALVLAGYVLKDDEIVKVGIYRFEEIFIWYSRAYHILEDGVAEEESPFYQLYVLDQVVQFLEYVNCWTEFKLKDHVLHSVRNMATYSHASTLHNNELFPFGTTPKRKVFGAIGEGVVTEKSYSKIREHFPIQTKRFHGERAGIWIWEQKEWHLFFNYAAHTFNKYHRDYDALSLMLATKQEGLWLSDPGPFARHGDKEWESERAEHFRATQHHNTVTVDGKDQLPETGKLIKDHGNTIKASFGIHEREIKVSDTQIDVRDVMHPEDSETHTYRQTWHLDPEVRVEGMKMYKGQQCIQIKSKHTMTSRRAKHSNDYHHSMDTLELIFDVEQSGKTKIDVTFRMC